ncbi:MAG: chorismate synthase [Nitrospirae bacterium GWC2_57_13]|jgi:chorismate synthase|nr:MAG: chorismate synthase [Nitrospirae bacterium GWC2_57_13]OGW42842.1 MAG: chorismate synthase [Nitrospirae bacterium GWD2_57_8]
MLRYLTAGESHGELLMGIIEGLPSGLTIRVTDIDRDLGRRQVGYGRGGRMKIEKDSVKIYTGVRWGRTLGSPLGLMVRNKDWDNWRDKMSPDSAFLNTANPVTRPRPGHADLAGALKYNSFDIRNILERSSARETAMRVAVGAVAKRLLEEFNIEVMSHVVSIGGVFAKVPQGSPKELARLAENSELRCADHEAAKRMKKKIDEAQAAGDSLGGVFEVIISGAPAGLGSHVHWDRKLDAMLAGALMSVQAIKGVEVGSGFGAANLPGSKVHDEIFWNRKSGFYRKTNSAGGIEGGMSNGERITLRAAMKPIPTLMKPLNSVDLESKKAFKAGVERSDVCAVPAAGVVGEAVVALEIAAAMMEKFGGDSIEEVKRNYNGYMKNVMRRSGMELETEGVRGK